MRPPTVFVSYSHRDESARSALASHLGVLMREGLLESWDDQRIAGGDDWKIEIEGPLSTARVAVLLVSADFLNSDFVRSVEVPRLLARRQKEGLRVIPIIIRPCVWKALPWLASIQVRPKKGTPILGLSPIEQEAAWADIAEEIYRLMRDESDSSRIPSPTAEIISEPDRHDDDDAEDLVTETVELEAGTFVELRLDVEKGDRIEGKLVETSGQAFDYFIMDESNLTDFISGDDYETGSEDSDRPAYPINWRVPRKGPWVLVLDASGKKADREVEVELRFGASRHRAGKR